MSPSDISMRPPSARLRWYRQARAWLLSSLPAMLQRHRTRLLVTGAVLLGYLVLFPPALDAHSGARAAHPEAPTSLAGLHTTHFVSHVPGFSLVENIYWRNWTFYAVTDTPNLVPRMDQVVTEGLTMIPEVHPAGDPGVLVGIREAPVSPSVDDHPGVSMSLDDAVREFGNAHLIPGDVLLTSDNIFVAHYYHWIGEIFLGAWRLWSNYYWRLGMRPRDFTTVSFVRQYSKTEVAPDVYLDFYWEDPAGLNEYLMKNPRATYETRRDWEQRAATNDYYRIGRCLLADRKAGQYATRGGKPFIDALRLPVNADYLLALRERVIPNRAVTAAARRRAHPDRPAVLYTTRQGSNRRLAGHVHEELVRELAKLDAEGIADVQVMEFTSDMSIEDQLARIASIDILIGVHGNGLTHAMWMTPGAQKAVFEFQPKGCNWNDYAPLAMAAGVQHYLVSGDRLCTPLECPERGCWGEFETVNIDDIVIDPFLVTDQIRRILGGRA